MEVFKYYSLTPYHVQSLANDQFYMAKVEEFNDPFELCFRLDIPQFTSLGDALEYHRETLAPIINGTQGSSIRSTGDSDLDAVFHDVYTNLETFNKFLSGIQRNTGFPTDMAKKVSDVVGISCFCKTESNEHMWTYYADGLKGVCIGYDLPDLHGINGSLREVNYENPISPEISLDLFSENNKSLADELLKLIFMKNPRFESEEEIRLAMNRKDLHDERYYIHEKNAIKSVCFGENITPENKRLVMRLFSGSGYEDVKYYEAFAKTADYSIEVKYLYDQRFVEANS